MRGMFRGFRDGYGEARDRFGPPRPFFEWPKQQASAPALVENVVEDWTHAPAPAVPVDDAGEDWPARAAELQAALDERGSVMAAMMAHINELESAPASEVLEAVLRLPGVEKWLRDRFHPDKHPKADDAERRLLNEATQKVNAAYAELKRKKPAPPAA